MGQAHGPCSRDKGLTQPTECPHLPEDCSPYEPGAESGVNRHLSELDEYEQGAKDVKDENWSFYIEEDKLEEPSTSRKWRIYDRQAGNESAPKSEIREHTIKELDDRPAKNNKSKQVSKRQSHEKHERKVEEESSVKNEKITKSKKEIKTREPREEPHAESIPKTSPETQTHENSLTKDRDDHESREVLEKKVVSKTDDAKNLVKPKPEKIKDESGSPSKVEKGYKETDLESKASKDTKYALKHESQKPENAGKVKISKPIFDEKPKEQQEDTTTKLSTKDVKETKRKWSWFTRKKDRSPQSETAKVNEAKASSPGDIQADKKSQETSRNAKDDTESRSRVNLRITDSDGMDGTVGQKVIYRDENGRRVDPPRYESETNYVYNIMAPPFYSDLGKKANDVFGKGYHFGVIKLDLKTKSESGVEFSSGIVSNQESGKVFGSLQSKYAVKDYGLTFTEKWNTDNTLATDITIQDKIAAGLKITLEGTFAPQTGSKSGKLKTQFANDTVAVNTNFDLDLAGPIVDVAGVLKYQGWLAGVNSQFDTQKGKFSKNNFALGYAMNDFALHTNVDNGKDFGGSIYQKVSDKLDCGISMKWAAGSADTLFGVGAKFALDQDASLHAKINNKSLIGLGYQQKLRPGVTLTLSAAIDGQNFNAGGHKVGLALELEP